MAENFKSMSPAASFMAVEWNFKRHPPAAI